MLDNLWKNGIMVALNVHACEEDVVVVKVLLYIL